MIIVDQTFESRLAVWPFDGVTSQGIIMRHTHSLLIHHDLYKDKQMHYQLENPQSVLTSLIVVIAKRQRSHNLLPTVFSARVATRTARQQHVCNRHH